MGVQIPERVIQRIWDSVDIGAWLDCWPWTKSTGSHGYGQVGWHDSGRGRNVMTTAHRAAYEALNGPIPGDLQVDHICRNRVCCNPLHLRLLALTANASDNANKRKTHCPRGHVYNDENTYTQPRTGYRSCKVCLRERRGII